MTLLVVVGAAPKQDRRGVRPECDRPGARRWRPRGSGRCPRLRRSPLAPRPRLSGIDEDPPAHEGVPVLMRGGDRGEELVGRLVGQGPGAVGLRAPLADDVRLAGRLLAARRRSSGRRRGSRAATAARARSKWKETSRAGRRSGRARPRPARRRTRARAASARRWRSALGRRSCEAGRPAPSSGPIRRSARTAGRRLPGSRSACFRSSAA